MELYKVVNTAKKYTSISKTVLYDNKNKAGFWIFIFSSAGAMFSLLYPLFGALLYGMIILNRRTTVLEHKNEIDTFDSDIPSIIDKIIDDAFNEYILLNKGYKKEYVYINSVEEQHIVDEMINKVSARLSDAMIYKLNSFYNKDEVPSIISTRIYMAVMAYVVDNNSVKEDLNTKVK